MVVHEGLQQKLNRVFSETIDFSALSYKEVVAEADRYKESSSYLLAIKYYEEAIKRGSLVAIKYVYPRITSCYRKSNQPQKAVELFIRLQKEYGSTLLSPPLLTSVAAAYCDLSDFAAARKCCNRAYAMSNGEISPELQMVYQRLRSEEY